VHHLFPNPEAPRLETLSSEGLAAASKRSIGSPAHRHGRLDPELTIPVARTRAGEGADVHASTDACFVSMEPLRQLSWIFQFFTESRPDRFSAADALTSDPSPCGRRFGS